MCWSELLEGNNTEIVKHADVLSLKNQTDKKDVIKAVNTFVQDKLNTIADTNTIVDFNKTIKSKKFFTKMIADEHYLAINNNNTLQVVDGIKDTQGKPIDLDKRGHRKLVWMYLNYIISQNNLTEPQKTAAADLISYINDLNRLAQDYDWQERSLLTPLNKLLHKVKKSWSPSWSTTDNNPWLATALNKDLNLDSKKHSYLDITQGASFVQQVEDGKIKEWIDKTIKGDIILPTWAIYGSYNWEKNTTNGWHKVNVELKNIPWNKIWTLILEMDDKSVITKATWDDNLKKLYTVTLNNGKVTFADVKEAEDKKKLEVATTKIGEFLKDASKLILPTWLTASLKTNWVTLNADGTYTTIVSLADGSTSPSVWEMTLTFDANHGINAAVWSLTWYEATLTNGVITVSKKAEEAKEDNDEVVIKPQELIDDLKIPLGKKLLDLNDSTTKTNLERAFGVIAKITWYTDIIKKTSDASIDLDATIKAFQAAYMKANPNSSKIWWKDGKPDGKIWPKTLAAIKSLLWNDSGDEGSGSNWNDSGSDWSNSGKKNDESEGSEENKENKNDDALREKYKKEYSLLFEKYNNTQSTILIEEVDKDSFLLRIKEGPTTTNGQSIEFTVSRDTTNKITDIQAKWHTYPSFYQWSTYIEVIENSNKKGDYFYKIMHGGKDFLVWYDSSKKKWMYDVVDIPPSQVNKPIQEEDKNAAWKYPYWRPKKLRSL